LSVFPLACLYVVVGLCRDGRKQILSCLGCPGRENLKDGKLMLRGLLERGLRRVLILVHDDFSGLLPITQSLFSNVDVQRCAVHMQRNAKTHLSKTEGVNLHDGHGEELRDVIPIGVCQRPGCEKLFVIERKGRGHFL
jgi:transposase-like protein